MDNGLHASLLFRDTCGELLVLNRLASPIKKYRKMLASRKERQADKVAIHNVKTRAASLWRALDRLKPSECCFIEVEKGAHYKQKKS